jgi:toxin YoeB
MRKSWFDEAWDDYESWQREDKKTLKKINALLKDIDRNGYEGIGHPEPLRNELSGWHSRKINEYDRLVYRIDGDVISILSCKGHYEGIKERF